MLALPLGAGAELRPLEPWQAPEFAAYVDANRAHLAPWLPWAHTITSTETAQAWLQRYADAQARDAGRVYGLWWGDVLVGGTLFRVFDPASGTCEIGVWLTPEAERHGLITQATRHMIDWAVGVRGMTRVEWRSDTNNERSIAVAKRLGMRRDGVLREAFIIDGVRRDIEVWSMLAHEWTARR